VHLATSEGPGAARNHGVARSSAPVLAFTDADCFPTPGWLAAGLRALDRADLVQGRVEPDPAVPRTPFDRTLAVEHDGGFYQTANLFIRRETFESVGGFRDWALERPRRWSEDRRRGRAARTPIGEDTVFAWTARRGGARSAFAADALVHHAVVGGGLRDEVADRWHWTVDMPGLVRLVPELRRETLHRRWFFSHWTAQFDLAIVALALAAASRRGWWLIGAAPYVRRLARESRRYGRRGAPAFLIGTPAVEAATLAGLVSGSVVWRCVVL
jgi:glycosyltransferase involved in cell wall biosynthesis